MWLTLPIGRHGRRRNLIRVAAVVKIAVPEMVGLGIGLILSPSDQITSIPMGSFADADSLLNDGKVSFRAASCSRRD